MKNIILKTLRWLGGLIAFPIITLLGLAFQTVIGMNSNLPTILSLFEWILKNILVISFFIGLFVFISITISLIIYEILKKSIINKFNSLNKEAIENIKEIKDDIRELLKCSRIEKEMNATSVMLLREFIIPKIYKNNSEFIKELDKYPELYVDGIKYSGYSQEIIDKVAFNRQKMDDSIIHNNYSEEIKTMQKQLLSIENKYNKPD